MSSTDKYIFIEESRNPGDDSSGNDDTSGETEVDSANTLNSQGIFIQKTESSEGPLVSEPQDVFSQELFGEGGVEILPRNDRDEF